MEEAARCRRTARSAVGDVEPTALRETIEAVLEDGSAAPGALVLASAREALADTDGDPPDRVEERAAGVQLIYDGLRSIRTLAGENPWEGVVTVDGAPPVEDLTEENLAMLAADVLVARGFYLLARTEAAGKAVETVRNFGRDQTVSRTGENRDVNLEVDVLQLAVLAGTTAVGDDPCPEALSSVAELARGFGTPLPAADAVLAEFPSGGVRADAADGAARTSATDP